MHPLLRFPQFKDDWNEVKLGEVLSESKIPDTLQDPDKRLTVKLHLKGIFRRGYDGRESIDATTYYRRNAGQFIYGKQNIFRGSIGVVPQELDGYCSSSDLPAFDVDESCNNYFIFYYFARKKFYEDLELYATGTGSKRVQVPLFQTLPISLPSLPEQEKIAGFLTAVDEKIANLKAQTQAVERYKKGLMQQLFNN